MKKILLVDDNPEYLNMLCRMVKLLGYEPVKAESGLIGLELVKKPLPEEYECVITDIEMPELSGWGLLRQLRTINFDLPVIGMSGKSQYHNLFIARGGWLFLEKSEIIVKLDRSIKEVMEKAFLRKMMRDCPRINVEGELLISTSDGVYPATLGNLSRMGIMFEIEKGIDLEAGFSAQITTPGLEIAVRSLERIWEEHNDDNRILVGSRIKEIDLYSAKALEGYLSPNSQYS